MTDRKNEDIQEYIEAYRRGEEKGFTYFYTSLYPCIFLNAMRKFGNKVSVKDIVADAFRKLWENRPDCNHPNEIRSWLDTTVKHLCIDEIRRQGPRKKYENEMIASQQAAAEERDDDEIIFAAYIDNVHNNLAILPPQCRIVFTMLYVQGKTIREIAEELQLSISTVKSHKAYGLEILKKKLGWAIVIGAGFLWQFMIVCL
jgi:RNA polymerase sigma-70 factor (family 1)